MVYEDGVFKPLEKVELEEGERLEIEVKERITKRTKGILKNANMKMIIEEIENEGVL